MQTNELSKSQKIVPLLGEFAWHSLTIDPTIDQVSKLHFDQIERILRDHARIFGGVPPKILEVGSYAHTTGYSLADRLGADVALFDISARALKLGRTLARREAGQGNPKLVAGDFHDLPFADESFDLALICSAIHHTWRWQTVVEELLRVVNSGGLLFVENEPCRRTCCFYKFRANRGYNLTAFEKRLEELGVLRTFGEPYPGSRPESMFGMIENQRIPLRELLALVESRADLVELELIPEGNMTELEHRWVQRADLGREGLTGLIEEDLLKACALVGPSMGPKEFGLGFSLPCDEEVGWLAATVATAIAALPPDPQSREYRIALTDLFGGSVRFVARKRGPEVHAPSGPSRLAGALRFLAQKRAPEGRASSGHFRRDCQLKDGVAFAFDADAARLLTEGHSLLPDIQTAGLDVLLRSFPGECWSVSEANGIKQLGLENPPGVIKLPDDGREKVLILRYYCAPPEDGPALVSVRAGDRVLHTNSVWHPNSFLALIKISGDLTRGAPQVSVQCETTDGQGTMQPWKAFAVSVAALIPVD